MRPLWDVSIGTRPSWWQRRTPPQLLAGSFAILIVIGTLGFKCLPGLYTGEPLSWIDAVFTTTSAVCTTGLIVVDTATYFTPAGQLWILILIQCGGLGILTFTSLIILALGGRLSLRYEGILVSNPLEIGYYRISAARLFQGVLTFTLGFELIGAAILYVIWAPQMGWVNAIWPAIFHAISAFCNAGFSTFSENMVAFRHDHATLSIIAALALCGGISFLTWEELYLYFRQPMGRRFVLSLHSRLVLWMALLLAVLPTPLFFWLESERLFANMSWWDRWFNAFFICACARTSGFNAVDHGQGSDAANFLMIILMAIGGSPGSMAGGMKTTTLALLLILAWSRFRGWEVTSIWGRSLRKETTDRAVSLFIAGFTAMTIGILGLVITEEGRSSGRFLALMFEAVSAFNLVGVSMGVTSELSPMGRIIIIGMMYVGRIGPLVIAAALARPAQVTGKFRYAYEEVAIG